MSIVTDLYATLNADAGVRAIVGEATSPQHSRIYPNHAPESADITFQHHQGCQRSGAEPGTDQLP